MEVYESEKLFLTLIYIYISGDISSGYLTPSTAPVGLLDHPRRPDCPPELLLNVSLTGASSLPGAELSRFFQAEPSRFSSQAELKYKNVEKS